MRIATTNGWREIVWQAGYEPLSDDHTVFSTQAIFGTREQAQKWVDEQNEKLDAEMGGEIAVDGYRVLKATVVDFPDEDLNLPVDAV